MKKDEAFEKVSRLRRAREQAICLRDACREELVRVARETKDAHKQDEIRRSAKQARSRREMFRRKTQSELREELVLRDRQIRDMSVELFVAEKQWKVLLLIEKLGQCDVCPCCGQPKVDDDEWALLCQGDVIVRGDVKAALKERQMTVCV